MARLSLGLGLALVVGFILWHHRYRLIDAWTAVVTPNLILLAGLGSFAIMNFDRAHFNLFAAQLGRRHQVDWVVNPTSGVSRLELALGSFLFYTSALLIISLLGSVLLWNTFGSSLQRLNQALVGVAGLAIALAALISVIYLSIIISWQNPGLQQLQTLSDYVKSITTPSDRLFTFETALAANTGRPVTPGTAMSYFSYFPKFSTDQATRYQVVNEDLLSDQLTRREAELVLLTDFDVHLIRNPANSSRTEPVALTQAQLFTLFPELKGGYYLAKTTANYSEWNNPLYIFRLNKED
ncbi:MAG: hypothetical protein P8186_29635 [Anaerolineae bacterium]